MKISRTESSLKNVKITLIVYFFNLLLQFVSRMIFLKFLTVDYLGINGLFSNILSMLNLTELGIGSAMAYVLYKPCADDNFEMIKKIMYLYKKMYVFIGIIILVVGLFLTPFLPYFIKDMPTNLGNIYIFYTLYLFNTAVSYFFTYKRSLIICYQKQYISTLTNFFKNLFMCVFQLIFLWLTRNYYIYLCIQIIFTIFENILISKIADKKYPFLKEKTEYPPKYIIESIKKNIFAMSFHKIGGVIVNGTDNIIITKFVSLKATGLYSNYSIIISACTSLISQIFFSLTASVGNLIAESEDNKIYFTFKRMFFLNFLIYFFSAIGLFCLVDDFISIWIGEEFLLSKTILICIILSYFSNGMRRTVLTFKDAKGLFWNDRYKPLIESFSNLVLSIPLAIAYGISGTLVGTIITNIGVAGTIEAYVLYKNGFHRKVTEYYVLELKYYTFFLINLFIMDLFLRYINFNHLINLCVKGTILFMILIIEIVFFFRKKDEFKYLIRIIKHRSNIGDK